MIADGLTKAMDLIKYIHSCKMINLEDLQGSTFVRIETGSD